MKKANVEGSGVRMVKLARGSTQSDTSPPRTTSTPSGRFPLGRVALSRGLSVDEKEAATNGIHALNAVGFAEILDLDHRLTCIVDLENAANFQPGPLYLVFTNAALKAYADILDMIRGRRIEAHSGLGTSSTTFAEFKAWATSFYNFKEKEAMDVSIPTFQYAGVVWSCSTLRKRFRMICGTSLAPPSITSNPPSTGNVVQSIEVLQQENADYFGQSAMPREANQTENALFSLDDSLSSFQTAKTTLTLETSMVAPADSKPHSPLDVFHYTIPSPSTTSREASAVSPSGQQGDSFRLPMAQAEYLFDWTRLPVTPAMPRHLRFARTIDWASTCLGPIEHWPVSLRSMCNLLMASPHPAAMYWGEDLICIYNEPYIMLAGHKHPDLMGKPYREAWKEIWEELKHSFAAAIVTGQSTMKDDDCLFLDRSGFLEETYFSWSLIPIVGEGGTVAGFYNPAFEKTRRKVAERRMLTLRDVGEMTASAKEVKGFWGQVIKGLDFNEYDTPFVLLYSVSDESESDASSMHSNSIYGARQCILQGTLPALPGGHLAAPSVMELKTSNEGFCPIFRDAITTDKPILLEVSNGTLNPEIIEGIPWRGFGEPPRAAAVCPIHPTTGESILGFLVMGINPRRPYDDDYNLFVQLLSRQLATSMASVVLFEDEIRRGRLAAKLAALDRIDLSEQLAARTQEVVESETKFTRMAEFAPVGMFIANAEGQMTFTNDTFHQISRHPKEDQSDTWMDFVKDEDKALVKTHWHNLIENKMAMSVEFRFKTPWRDQDGNAGDTWVLASAYPEQDEGGHLRLVFGCITNISQQKWAEDLQKRRTEEAVELKRQQSNFIDMTSHEMRNPLSAILQCADEISGSLIEFKYNPGAYEIPTALLDSNIDAAQTIALCANHQTRIVSDVLTMSKLDSALLLVTPVDAQPVTIVQHAMKMFEGELHTADIKMDFKVDESLSGLNVDWVRVDPSRLLQVLINLITNAIKFTTAQNKRVITISISASLKRPSELESAHVSYIPTKSGRKDTCEGKDWGEGEELFINVAVQDTGKGLDESEKKLLFLRFSQASPKTHVQYGGSGLGLFISRELVELQGGEIGVSSERGKGSTFGFYIKVRRSTGPSEDQTLLSPAMRKPSSHRSTKTMNSKITKDHDIHTSSTSQGPMDHLKVLIVEDNLVNQKVLCKQLRNLGCVVSLANHGVECLEHLEKTKYWKGHEKDGLELTVILMDLEMPIMDGLTCTRRIRELQIEGSVIGHVPIIAV